MAATNDTIEGLLAEFRGYAAGMPDSYHVTMSWADFRKMLDRFDAAHKRELDELRKQVGDAAKLREALAAYLALWDNGTTNNLDELKRVIKQMREALSAPPRNCDIPNIDERFDEFCRTQKYCCECKHHAKGSDCKEAWLLDTAYKSEVVK